MTHEEKHLEMTKIFFEKEKFISNEKMNQLLNFIQTEEKNKEAKINNMFELLKKQKKYVNSLHEDACISKVYMKRNITKTPRGKHLLKSLKNYLDINVEIKNLQREIKFYTNEKKIERIAFRETKYQAHNPVITVDIVSF